MLNLDPALIPGWLVMLPLLAAVLGFMGGRRAGAGLALLPVLLLPPLLLELTLAVLAQGPLRHHVGDWEAPLGIALYVDGLALAMLWLTTLVAAAITLYARQQAWAEGFWPTWLLLWTGLNALFLTADIFNAYVALELLTLAAVGLVAQADGAAALRGALRYLLFALFGSLSFLLGVALLYAAYGVLDLALLAEAGRADAATLLAAALLIMGLLLKAALFPLHTWLPAAHGAAPAAVSAVLSALVVKGALYLLLRLWFEVLAPVVSVPGAHLLGLLGAGAILYGSALALRQTRLKLLVAYSTVAQLGYPLLALPLAGALAWNGLVLHLVSHGLAKAALFLAAGNILYALGHDAIRGFKGLARRLPLTVFAVALAGVTLMGLPPSAGFLAKWLLLVAAVEAGQWAYALVILAGGLLAAAYVFRVLRAAFASDDTELAPLRLGRLQEWLPLLLAAAALLLSLGVAPFLALLNPGSPFPLDLPPLVGDTSFALLALLTPFVTGIAIFLLGDRHERLRTALNLGGALFNLAVVGIVLLGVYNDQSYTERLSVLPGLDLVLRADAFALLFMALSAVLWLLTTLYAVGYLKHHRHDRARFFGFFSLCVGATMGVAMSGNLITFFIFYEILTLATWPLVVHSGSRAALAAGDGYLRYTLLGSAALLVGIVWLTALGGSQAFTEGGVLAGADPAQHPTLILIFLLLVGGFGVKAALFPLHGWLPQSMVAPAPVSALLHAVAVVKAGAFGIVRVVYDIYGTQFAHDLGVTGVLAALAAVTIVYGSVRALAQDDLKRRLAYSTVSQVSYIVLGVAVAGPLATVGGVVHLVHQGLMKITLFFCAGNLAEELHIKRVSQMDGCGRRMPWTLLAFTLAAFGMIGVPPLAGFVSKWYLGLGGLAAGEYWVVAVLLASTLLNAAYFLPILYRVWFAPAPAVWPSGEGTAHVPRRETDWALLLPPLLTAALALGAGLLAAAPFSPLQWALLITEREYR